MAQMQEVYGEFATSLTERVKRRRNHQPSYRDDDASDSETQHQGSLSKIDGSTKSHYADEVNSESSNASFLEGSFFVIQCPKCRLASRVCWCDFIAVNWFAYQLEQTFLGSRTEE